MIKKQARNKGRRFRHLRVRKKVHGTADRPRMVVFKSLKQMYVQVIDDDAGNTLVSASSLEKDLKGLNAQEKAGKVGALTAERAKEKGISSVVFDRAGYKYHGRVAALANAARENGLEF